MALNICIYLVLCLVAPKCVSGQVVFALKQCKRSSGNYEMAILLLGTDATTEMQQLKEG